MFNLELTENRELKMILRESIYVGENEITPVGITLPESIGGYVLSQCEVNLYAVLEDGTHLVYPVTGNERPYRKASDSKAFY